VTGALLLALAVSAASGDPVVARIGRAELRRSEVTARAALLGASGRPAAAELALEGLIREVIMAEEGRRLGLAGSAAANELIQAETRRAAGDSLAAELTERAEVPEARLRELFHSTADLATFDTLVYATREEAADAAGRLARGGTLEAEAPRALIAKLFATPSEARPVARAQIAPALAALLFAAAAGQVVGPVEAQDGAVLARLLAKELGTEAAFADRRPALIRFGKAQAGEQARRHLVAQRRAKATITVDEPFLAALRGNETAPAQLHHAVATVDGTPIRGRELLLAMYRLTAAGGHGSPSLAMKQQLLSTLVDERLFQQTAMEKGVDRFPAVVARAGDIERLALAQAAAQRTLDATPAPGEAEIEAFYQANATAYGRPFGEVLPDVAARAADRKRSAALEARIQALRQAAAVTIDRGALAAIDSNGAR
jgi:hypothetical protein